MLIDDDSSLIEIVQHASTNSFPEADFTQITTIDQAKAHFALIQGNKGPSLILLDINFHSAESGLDLLTSLRSNQQTCTLPIVMLTNSSVPADILSAYDKGVSSFTVKPDGINKWKEYFATLRAYWLQTVTLPPDYMI